MISLIKNDRCGSLVSNCDSYLYSQRLNVVGPVGSSGEVRQVKLDLVPAVVQPHRHGADEWLNSGC